MCGSSSSCPTRSVCGEPKRTLRLCRISDAEWVEQSPGSPFIRTTRPQNLHHCWKAAYVPRLPPKDRLSKSNHVLVGGEGPDVRVFEEQTHTGRLPVTQADSRCLAVLKKNTLDRPLTTAIDSFSYLHHSPSCPTSPALTASMPVGLGQDAILCKSYQATRLQDLPVEIQDRVLGHLVGHLGSTTSTSTQGHGSRNWNIAMRHPRRAQVSELALVSHTWRLLIQQRLYRHGNPRSYNTFASLLTAF